MSLEQVFGTLLVAAILGLVRHVIRDIETRRDVDLLKKRMSKIDGLNGK